jgi:hypothetical protein
VVNVHLAQLAERDLLLAGGHGLYLGAARTLSKQLSRYYLTARRCKSLVINNVNAFEDLAPDLCPDDIKSGQYDF